MAQQLGITPKAYGNIENNISDPTLSRLAQIAEIFGCDVNYIINYEQSKSGFYTNFYHNQGTGISHQGNVELDKLNHLFAEMRKMYEEMKILSVKNKA